MRPGPELDALVAAAVGHVPCVTWHVLNADGTGSALGFDDVWDGGEAAAKAYLSEQQSRGLMLGYHVGPRNSYLHYSTDATTCIAAAEEARKAGKITMWQIQANEDAYVAECFIHGLGYGADGETPAHALALALRKAVGMSQTREEQIARWEREGFMAPDCPGCAVFYAHPGLPSTLIEPNHRLCCYCERRHGTCDACW